MYFDSFGYPLSAYVNIISPRGKLNLENCRQLQHTTKYTCGDWCVWWIYNIFKGIKYATFLRKLTNNTYCNEIKLKSFINRIPNFNRTSTYADTGYQTCERLLDCPLYTKKV